MIYERAYANFSNQVAELMSAQKELENAIPVTEEIREKQRLAHLEVMRSYNKLLTKLQYYGINPA